MSELSEQQLDQWRDLLEARTGINLTQHRHILREGLDSWLPDLDPAEIDRQLKGEQQRFWAGVGRSLVDYLAVKDTRFYRNPGAYRVLSEYLLRRLHAADAGSSFDIWSAGCSTGEEVYTLAMVANEIIAQAGKEAYFGIIGSDISAAALSRAKAGRYRMSSIAQLPAGLRQKYLKPTGAGDYVIDPALARRVCFVQSNLLDPDCSPASPMDVIFCHNVLIYFRSWRQKEVLNLLAARLKPGGILVIGPGEGAGWNPAHMHRIIDDKVQVFTRANNNNREQSRAR